MMKWNNRIEESKFRKVQEIEKKALIRLGMTEEEISDFQEDAHEKHLRRRNEVENGFEIVPYFQVNQDGDEYIPDDPALQYEEDICEEDPFQYGFNDERLNQIVQHADETDLKILRMLSEGLTKTAAGKALDISQQAVSKRIKKLLKKISK